MTVVVEPSAAGAGGILGKEARHRWNGGVLMNDLTASPQVKLEAISGLHALPEPEDLREPAMGRRGEIPRTSERRGKTIVYEGVVRARTLAELRSQMSELAGNFASMAEGQMLVSPHPEYADGFTRFYGARVLTFEPGDEELLENIRGAWPYQQIFALALRMSDPGFYDPQEVIESTGTVAITGGLALPLTPPFTLLDSSAGAGSVTVTNTGNAPVDPVIDIYGPVTDPTIINVTTGRTLAFTGITLGSADFLRVDFASRQVLYQGTSDFRSKIDWPNSDWWDPSVEGLEPGDNLIQLRGSSVADPAYALITFNPAYYA